MKAKRIIVSNREEIERAYDIQEDLNIPMEIPKEQKTHEDFYFKLKNVLDFVHDSEKKTIKLRMSYHCDEEIIAENHILEKLKKQFED